MTRSATQAAPAGTPAQDAVDRFNAAWGAHDLPAALAMITSDCVFESTSPAPDGARYVGPGAISAAWAPIFADQAASFTAEESFAAGDRVVVRWRYDWDGGHVRGIDAYTVRDGLIAAKLAYVKG
jgi:ketosteroid isomerase-like protein